MGETQELKHNPISQKALNFWMPLILTLLSVAVTYGMWTTKLSALETNDNKQDVRIEVIEKSYTDIRVTLAEIQRDISYIRKQVDK